MPRSINPSLWPLLNFWLPCKDYQKVIAIIYYLVSVYLASLDRSHIVVDIAVLTDPATIINIRPFYM